MENNTRTLGIFLVAAGLAFFLFQWVGNYWAEIGWPFFIIGPGALILFTSFTANGLETKQFIGGATTLATGLILLAMSISGRWEAWSYAWAIYPVVTGAAMMYAGRRNGELETEQNGRKTLTAGIYMLAGFGLFFEVFIFGGNAGLLDSGLFPVLLIGAGGAVLFMSRNNNDKSKRKHDDDVYTF